MSDAQDSESISAYITDLQNQVRAPSPGLAVVIRVLAEPLSFLGYDIAHAPSDSVPQWSGPKEPTTARRLYFIQHLLPNHLDFILDHITVEWLSALPAAQQSTLFDAYFVPRSTSSQPRQEQEQLQCGQLDKAVAIISLQTLVGRINQSFHENHSFLSGTILRLLRKQLDTFSLTDYYQGCKLLSGGINPAVTAKSTSQTDTLWDTLLFKLFSIPTRISNAYGTSRIQTEQCFQEKLFFLRKATQLQSFLEFTASLEGEAQSQHARACAAVIAKFLRLGYGRILVESLVPAYWDLSSSKLSGLKLALQGSSSGSAQLFLTTLVEYLDGHQLAYESYENSPSTPVNYQLASVHRAAKLLVSIGFGVGEKNNSMVEGVLFQGRVFGVGVLRTLICVQTGWPAIVKIDKESALVQAFKKALSIWSDSMLVKHASTEYQKFVSHQLLLMLGYFNAKELLSMDTIPLFNAGMGNWLELENFGRKRISLVVAEEFARTIDTTGSSADFELDTSDPEIQFARSLVELKDGYVPFTLSAASQEEAAKTAAIINVDIQPRSTAMLPDDDGLAQQPADSDDEEDPDAILDPFARVTVSKDSDGETSDESDDDDLKPYDMEYESDPDEDPEAVRKPKVAAPLYLRDLLSYIRASEDRAKVQVGLQTGEELIRRKAGSLELEEYAEDLANTFCLLQDNFDTPNFYKLREGVLVALVVTAPVASVGVLTEQFYAKKNSQGQRMNILNTLGRGAEELSGLDPSIAASSSASQDAAGFSVKNGTTRQQTRQSPTSLSVGTAATTLTPHKPTFESISTSIAIEKTRRFSQKSQIEARRVAPKANAFANLAPVFLGGLLGRWGGNRGPGAERGYDTMLRAPAMLLKKFVLTIACLVHFAGNSPHLLPITRELFQFLLTIRYHSPPVQPKPGHLPPGLSATHPEAFLSSVMTAATLAEQPLTSLKLPGDIGISSTGPSERAISQVSSTVPYNAELVENILFGLLILVTPSPAALSDELLLAEFYPEIMECQQWAMELWEEQRLKESEDKTKMYCAGLLQRCFELLKIS